MAWSAPSHYLNQCWNIVNWTLRNKLQCNFNPNYNIFIQENAFESVVYEMAAILPQPQCVILSIGELLFVSQIFLFLYISIASRQWSWKYVAFKIFLYGSNHLQRLSTLVFDITNRVFPVNYIIKAQSNAFAIFNLGDNFEVEIMELITWHINF